MANERRGDRRQGRPGGGGGGGGYGDFRPHRGRPPRSGPPRGSFGDEAPRDFAPRQGRPPYPPRTGGGYAPRAAADEGGMAIRVDPRRLSLLKELAAAEGLRPGQLVQRWVEERLDAERTGAPSSPVGTDPRVAVIEATLATLAARIEEVAQRVQSVPAAPAPRRRGRPPKARAEAA